MNAISSVSSTHLFDLPDEMLSNIFRVLIIHRDFCRFSVANKRLFRVSQLPESWFGLTWRIEQTLFSSAPLKEVFRKEAKGIALAGDYLIYTVTEGLEVYHLKTKETKPHKVTCTHFVGIEGIFPALATLTKSNFQIWNLNQIMQEEAPQPILEMDCPQFTWGGIYCKSHRHFFCVTEQNDVLILDLSSLPITSVKITNPWPFMQGIGPVAFSETHVLLVDAWNGHYLVYELQALRNGMEPQPVGRYEPNEILRFIQFSGDTVTLLVMIEEFPDAPIPEKIREVDWRTGATLREWSLPNMCDLEYANCYGLCHNVLHRFKHSFNGCTILDRNTLQKLHVRPFANAIVSSDLVRNFLMTCEDDKTVALYDLTFLVEKIGQ